MNLKMQGNLAEIQDKKITIENPDVRISLEKSKTKDFKFENKLKIQFVAAVSEQQKRLVFETRYQAYIQRKEIEPNTEEIFFDKYDDNVNSHNYLAYMGDKLVGTIRAIVYKSGTAKPPSFEDYSDILSGLVDLDSVVVERCRFAILEEYSKHKYFIVLPFFKLIGAIASNNDATNIITTVRKSHKAIYERIMGFECVSDERNYPGVNFKTVLLHCDLKERIKVAKVQQPLLYDYFFKQ